MNNYTIYHCHTDISNLSGAGMDSVTKYQDYVARAKECGMNALCFSEHGNFFLWKKKKDAIEAAGMKYLHGIEIYVAEKLLWETEDNPNPHKVRDNYHCVLIAKNLAGLKELNKLSSIAFREEQRYYSPRITFEQLINTSDNIIITTACVGGILCKGNEDIKNRFIEFLAEHKDRCFLEIQHHNVEKQKEYNLYLHELSQKYGIPLIAGTDTHALNDVHAEARKVLQKSKKVQFNDDEAEWDLTFKTYDELVKAYQKQNCLPESVYLEAIQNTNVMADMVENITLDTSFKYPKVFPNSTELLRSKLFNETSIRYAMEDGFTREQVVDRLNEEMETFIAVDAVDYILLQEYIATWCHNHDIWCGPARGSAASSLALYILHVTEVNPMKHNFAFWRFMNKDKYSLADVDLDWGNEDRDRTKYWMLHDKMDFSNMQTTEIITFNTLGLRGAIRDFGRGLDISLDTVNEICNAICLVSEGENKKEVIDESWRKKYAELFKYVDLAQGVCTSIGAHASGVVAASTDVDLEAEIGTCYLKGDEYLVSVLNMKELDSLNFVKEDVLGLTNISCINKSCKLANIPKLTAKTVDVNDDKVWESVRDDTSLIFEVNSPYGARTVSQMYSDKVWRKIKKSNPSITKFDLFAYISALIRPCGKEVYPKAVQGEGYVSGVKDIDDLLANEMGYPIMQESQMSFVQNFCGYTFLQSDKLRKCVARGSKILMSDGSLKNIEDIEIGDTVCTFDDYACSSNKVISKYDNGKKRIVEVKCDSGFKIRCTADHRILTQRGYVEAKDLTTKDFVFTPKTIKKYNDGIKSNRKPSNDTLWMLGALIGDGTIYSKEHLAFTNSDIEIIEKFKASVAQIGVKGNPDFSIFIADGKTVDKVYQCKIKSGSFKDSIWNLIVKFGLNHKAAEKEIPIQVQHYSATEKLAYFLAGMFNTDGGYNLGRGTIEYYSISKNLVYQLQAQLLKFGIYSQVGTKKVSGYDYNSYILAIGDKKSLHSFRDNILCYVVGNKYNELNNIILSNNTGRYFVPESCKKEFLKYCHDRNLSMRDVSLEKFGKEIRTTNGYPLNIDDAKEMCSAVYMPETYAIVNSDFITQRVISVCDDGEDEVYDIGVENTHNFIADGVVCHNCVAKKLGTKDQLPIIRKGFEENAKVRYHLSDAKTDEIMNVFLNCILYATRYSFSSIHSYSYAYISYECAWLRYYYPLEFLSCCLNEWQGNSERTIEATTYATKKKIKILPPKFRHSKAEYFPDKESNSIYKGIGSVKFMNQSCADDLYNLRNNNYNSFVDLLRDIYGKTSVNARQLDILIKLDFFEEFGNAKELLRLVKMYDMFGEAKKIGKEKLANSDVVRAIVERHSIGITKAGKEAKFYSQLDNMAILNECETLIMSLGIKPMTIKEKAEIQKEYMGYVDIATGKQEDRPKLYILDVKTLKSKTTGKTWARQITAQSIGSGKQSNYTITSKNYHEEFQVGDVILCKHLEKQKDYWHITNYEVLVNI